MSDIQHTCDMGDGQTICVCAAIQAQEEFLASMAETLRDHDLWPSE